MELLLVILVINTGSRRRTFSCMSIKTPMKIVFSVIVQPRGSWAVWDSYLEILLISLWFMVLSTDESPTLLRIHSSMPIRVYRNNMAAKGSTNRATMMKVEYTCLWLRECQLSWQHTWWWSYRKSYFTWKWQEENHQINIWFTCRQVPSTRNTLNTSNCCTNSIGDPTITEAIHTSPAGEEADNTDYMLMEDSSCLWAKPLCRCIMRTCVDMSTYYLASCTLFWMSTASSFSGEKQYPGISQWQCMSWWGCLSLWLWSVQRERSYTPRPLQRTHQRH